MNSKTSTLNFEDRKCLLDHLGKQSGQLLRKTDRCKLLLKISKITNYNSEGEMEKYFETISGLINQISKTETEIKFNLSCELIEMILSHRPLNNNLEEGIYEWMKEFVSNESNSDSDSTKMMKFYSIKLKYDEMKGENNGDYKNTENGNDNKGYIRNEDYNGNDDDDDDTIQDLQKLKIFESFQLNI